jgi:hypothetical protein
MKRLSTDDLDSETKTHHGQNQDIVASRLAFYKDELGLIREARAEVPTSDVPQAFMEDAQRILSQYGTDFAGHPRNTRDLVALCYLCDRMMAISAQLNDHGPALEDLDTFLLAQNFARDGQHLLEREYGRIAEAQQEG